jgi:hypothetical protein
MNRSDADEANGKAAAPAEELQPVEPQEKALEEFLPAAAPARIGLGMRSARLVDTFGRRATVVLRGEDSPIDVEIDAEVDAVVVQAALENGDRVMVEPDERGELSVVGVLQCRRPEKLKITAETVEIEAEREVVFRSGKSALRLREDGEIDLVGSRISAASRGLFRLVGRMLRLN